MSIYQLAKILQLAGFLLASIFGGILLDEVVGGKVAKGFTSLSVGIVDRLRRLMQKLGKGVIERTEGPWSIDWSVEGFGLASCLAGGFWAVSLTFLIIGWLTHISVLLWTGVGLYSVYAGVFLFMTRLLFAIRSIDAEFGEETVSLLGSILYIAALVSGILWLLLLTMYFISYLLNVFILIMKKAANPRVPKAAFTVLGFLILLTGLIIDVIAAF